MSEILKCASLEEVRSQIDRLDRDLVGLIAERGAYVRQSAGLKTDAAEVPAPARVAQVLARVSGHAVELGADPTVVEATWRAMIGAFIESERRAHAELHPPLAAPAPTPELNRSTPCPYPPPTSRLS